MPPEESNERPAGHEPMPRHRQPVDGFVRRPVVPERPQRPIFNQPPDAEQNQPSTMPSSPQPQIEPMEQPQQPLDFAPTKKSRRKLPVILIVGLGIVVVAGGAFGWSRWQAAQSKPDKIFRDGLEHALQTSYVSITMTSKDGETQNNLDLSNTKSPIVSSGATIKFSGQNFNVSGYGSINNTYFSYTKLPNGVKPELATVVQNGWVKVRTDGTQPLSANATLTRLIDPRQAAFGPVLFANLPAKLRDQLVSFMLSHRVYRYSLDEVKLTEFDGQKVVAFTVKPDIGYLKIVTQSVGNAAGFTPSDMQAATANLDELKSSTMTLYVAKSGHKVIGAQVSTPTGNLSLHYSHFTSSSVAAEPQTRLLWQSFAPYQYQLEAEVMKALPDGDVDKIRQGNLRQLHDFLALYFNQNDNYPSLSSLNDPNWVMSNLGLRDIELLRDPLGTSLQLANAPKPGTIAYQALPASGKGACDNTPAHQCVHYKLTATLSDGKQYSVQDP